MMSWALEFVSMPPFSRMEGEHEEWGFQISEFQEGTHFLEVRQSQSRTSSQTHWPGAFELLAGSPILLK